jgi:hypothetical protein
MPSLSSSVTSSAESILNFELPMAKQQLLKRERVDCRRDRCLDMVETAEANQVSRAVSSMLFPELEFGVADNGTYSVHSSLAP